MTLIMLWPNYYCFKLWYFGVDLGSSTVLVCSTLNRACFNSILDEVLLTSDSFVCIFCWHSSFRGNWYAITISVLFVGRIHCIRRSSEVGQVMIDLLNKNKNVTSSIYDSTVILTWQRLTERMVIRLKMNVCSKWENTRHFPYSSFIYCCCLTLLW